MPKPSDINQDTLNTCDSTGGLRKTFATPKSNVVDVTVDPLTGIITAMTMLAVGEITMLAFDLTDTASFNDGGTRIGTSGTLRNQDQVATLNFRRTSAAKIKTADEIADWCGGVYWHFYLNGIVKVQGINVNKTTGDWEFSKRNVLMTPTSNSDTGQNDDLMIFQIQNTDSRLAPISTMTEAEILLL